MDIIFTFIRTSEELLLGVPDFETTVDQISRVSVGHGGIVSNGQPVKWDYHERDILAAMNRTGAELVLLEGEEADGSKWTKTFKKNTYGKAELISKEASSETK